LGAAAEVHRSEQRARVLAALAEASQPLGPKEIMAELGRSDRNKCRRAAAPHSCRLRHRKSRPRQIHHPRVRFVRKSDSIVNRLKVQGETEARRI
jgi:hypothetical protein